MSSGYIVQCSSLETSGLCNTGMFKLLTPPTSRDLSRIIDKKKYNRIGHERLKLGAILI